MKKLIIFLDNGHGKDTPGKRSPKWKDIPQILEWEYNRKLVNKLFCKLTQLGYKTIIVTPEDIDISISERAKRVNTQAKQYGIKNCLGISIHLNAADNPRATGWEAHTYTGKSTSDKYSKIFYDVAPLKTKFKIRPNGPKDDPDWDSNFGILRLTSCPFILTENGFMTNYNDCKYLLSEEGFNDIINLHVDAIERINDKYFR